MATTSFFGERDQRVAKANRVFSQLQAQSPGGGSSDAEFISRRVCDGQTPELFDYQEEVVSKLQSLGDLKARRAMVSLPTGAGKTRTTAVFARGLLNMGRSVLWLAPSIELLGQAAQALEQAWRVAGTVPLTIARLPLGPQPIDTPIVVYLATAQWLARQSDLTSTLGTRDIGLIVFDEAHHAIADTFVRGLERAEAAIGPQVLVVGLSATPGRTDPDETQRLVEFFDRRLVHSELLGRDPVEELQERGVLSRIKYQTYDTGFSDFPTSDDLERDHARFWKTVDVLAELGSKGRVLSFGATVRHCEALTAGLIASGARAVTVSSNLDEKQRERFLRWFTDGDVTILLNKSILTAGYDLPRLEVVHLAAPIRTPIRYEQAIGRALRGPKVGGQETAVVVQHEDHRRLHGQPESLKRFWDELWRPVSS